MSPVTWFRLLGLSALLITLGFAGPALTRQGKGKRYALLVGVKSYEHRKLSDLRYTENDAEELAAVLKQAAYDEVVVLTTTRGEKDDKARPTKVNIDRELTRLLGKITKHDLILIGLAGHGVQYEVKADSKKRDESFFCPADAKLIDSDDFVELTKSMLSFRSLFKQLDDSGAGSRLLLVDACRNDPGSSRNADTNAMPSVTRGTAALFACKGGEKAHETDKLGKGHGIFFYHVIEVLKGATKSDEGQVTWDHLTLHVRRAVTKAVPVLVGGGAKQTPHLMADIEGDPVLVRAVAVVKARDKDKGGKEEVNGPLDKEGKNGLGMKFVRVKKGRFLMGSTDQERKDIFALIQGEYKDGPPDWLKAEGPQHEVESTKDFYLGVYEVTQKEFRTLMGYNPSYFSKDGAGKEAAEYNTPPGAGKNLLTGDSDHYPVENVSYEDAQQFIDALNKQEKAQRGRWEYRLPTEAQWEYACRGGPTTSANPFHFDKPTRSLGAAHANFDQRYPHGDGEKGQWLERTCEVKSYKPNALGLYQMHGNVAEWCLDWYDAGYYGEASASTDPQGPEKPGAKSRAYRGGHWGSDGLDCRAASRRGRPPEYRNYYFGFRVAIVLPPK